MPTALIAALKGATIFDYIMFAAVVIIGARMGWWELKRKKLPDVNPNIDRHMMCISDTDELVSEKQYLKHIKLVREQMKICESAVEEVMRLMRDKFFTELVGIVGTSEEVLRTLNNVHYNNCVTIFGNRCIEDMRRMMRDNGLAEKSDAELRHYVHVKSAELIEMGRNVFDTYYTTSDDHRISRSRIHDMHKDIFPKGIEVFSSCIWECRRVAIAADNRIKEIDELLSALKGKVCQGGSG